MPPQATRNPWIDVAKGAGILLVIALLTIPVAIASELTRDFRRIMLLSILCGIFTCLAGLLVSYVAELPSGASIILCGGALLGLVRIGNRLFAGRKSPPPTLRQ